MAILFITLMISLCGFQMFFIAQRLTVINRAVLFTPKEIFEASIPLIQDSEEPELYFDQNLLRDNLLSYYDKCIKPYSLDYTLQLSFHQVGNSALCLMNRCQAVTVKVSSKVVFNYTYSRSIEYWIQNNKNGL